MDISDKAPHITPTLTSASTVRFNDSLIVKRFNCSANSHHEHEQEEITAPLFSVPWPNNAYTWNLEGPSFEDDNDILQILWERASLLRCINLGSGRSNKSPLPIWILQKSSTPENIDSRDLDICMEDFFELSELDELAIYVVRNLEASTPQKRTKKWMASSLVIVSVTADAAHYQY